MYVCLLNVLGANRESSVHANSVIQISTAKKKTVPNKTTTCIRFNFGQEICYYATLLKKFCTLDPTRSISRTIKEEMLLILLSLRRIAHQTWPVSPVRVYISLHRPVSTRRPWQPFLNLLSNLLLDQHFMSDKNAA